MASLDERTTDRDEANRLIAGSYGPSRLEVGGRRKRFDFRLWWSEQKRARIGYTRYGTDVTIEAPPIESWYVACFPTRGAIEVASGRDRVRLTTRRGAVLPPFDVLRFENTSDDCTMLSVQVSRGELEDELGAMLGRPLDQPIRFAMGFDLAAPHGGLFPSALRYLHEVVSPAAEMPAPAATIGPGPAVMERIDRLLVSGLLLAQPHNYSERLREPARPAPPERLRRALDRIEADPASVATAADLARTACLSLRALEEGFQRHLGVSPMRHLRDVRLARARELLLTGDPATTTVTDVALRVGALHLGRFAADYRRKYGVSPSETLRHASR